MPPLGLDFGNRARHQNRFFFFFFTRYNLGFYGMMAGIHFSDLLGWVLFSLFAFILIYFCHIPESRRFSSISPIPMILVQCFLVECPEYLRDVPSCFFRKLETGSRI